MEDMMEAAVVAVNLFDRDRGYTRSKERALDAEVSSAPEPPEQMPRSNNHHRNMTTTGTNSVLDPAPPSSSPGGSPKSGIFCLPDDYDDTENGGCCCGILLVRRRLLNIPTFHATVYLQFTLGFVILLVGLSLLIVSKINPGQQELTGFDSEMVNPIMTPEETQAYWIRLRGQIITAVISSPEDYGFDTAVTDNATMSEASAKLFQPMSPMWQALQWMALEDPLRPLSSNNVGQIVQRFTLATLYYEWSGTRWVLPPNYGWLRTSIDSTDEPHNFGLHNMSVDEVDLGIPFHECDWRGVGCDSEKRVISLVLNGDDIGISLVGTVPSIISQLQDLQELHLTRHLLEGNLPPELTELQALTSLDLSHNKYVNLDFHVLTKMRGLQNLNLNNNQLKTNISRTELNQLVELRFLDLSANDGLCGDPFAMMLDWPHLKQLNVGSTKCSGSLPIQIDQLTGLESLQTGGITLEGTIPTSISSCTNLRELNIGGTENPMSGLVGTIPTEIGNLTNLQFLNLAWNRFETTIPTEVGRMTSLAILNAPFNTGLVGTLPTELGLLSNSLLSLYFQFTSLDGTLPSEFNNLTKLENLNVVGTEMDGKISIDFCAIESLNEVRATCTAATCSCCMCSVRG